MKSNFIPYNFEKSRERVDDILKTSDKSFEEVDEIPARDNLTFNNGYYIKKTTALFVDIRNSSGLPSKYQRPVLARIYRSYLSEMVAAINGNVYCAEIELDGDCVWGIFNAQYTYQINSVFGTAAEISSVVDMLNCKYSKKGIDPIKVGIGLSFGRVLMIKAGYKGSGLNDVVWMGDVVNDAAKLCSFGNKLSSDLEMMVSDDFRHNLNEDNQSLLKWNANRSCYHGHVINISIDKWLDDNQCK